MLDQLFIGFIPLNVEKGTFDYLLVFLSFVIASFGAFTALSFANAMASAKTKQSINVYHMCGAFSLGGAIWSMHYIGMLAYRIRLDVSYDPFLTLVSLLVAFVAGYIVLIMAEGTHFKPIKLALTSLLLGMGISTMHYLGMGAMTFDGDLRYTPGLFFLSFAIAVIASAVALGIFHILRVRSREHGENIVLRIVISLLLGVAICGMHYTGMAASAFIPHHPCVAFPNQETIKIALITAVSTVMFLTTGLVLIHFQKLLVGQLLVLVVSVFLCGFIEQKSEHDLKIEKKSFQTEQHNEAVQAASKIELIFNRIYRGMIALGYMPGLRKISSDAKNFDTLHHKALQQNFDNLAYSTDIGKLYVVLSDFNPDTIDGATGLKEQPLLSLERRMLAVTVEHEPRIETKKIHNGLVEENNTNDLQLIKEQLVWYQKNFPKIKGVAELYPPLLSGHKVNAHFMDDDMDISSAVVFSVPFFSEDGALRGALSSVISLKAIKKLLPEKDAVLINRDYNFLMASMTTGQSALSWSWVSKNEPDPTLIYSEVIEIDVNDPVGQWKLWVGKSDQDFLASPVVKSIRAFQVGGYSIVAFLSLISSLILFLLNQNIQISRSREVAEQAMKAKSQFLANVSHEIRTPLNGVLATAELLMDTPLNEKQKKYVSVINNTGGLLRYILNDVLDYSKLDAGKLQLTPEVVSIREKVEKLKSLYSAAADNKGLKLSLEVDPKLPAKIMADPFRLFQIFSNLISNSIHYTPHGSVNVTFTLLGEFDKPVLLFSVTDTGIGIAKENMGLIFEQFYRVENKLSEPGAGLGLSICQSLVHLMGGTIGVESEVGKGSRFWVNLPLNVVEWHEPNRIVSIQKSLRPLDEQKDPSELNSAYVLLVDDIETNRFVISEMLMSMGCKVETADNGQQAVVKATGNNYDIIFMNCSMPILDGFEATKTLRRLGHIKPIIAVTAHVLNEEIQRCLSSGMNDYVPKPVQKSELERIIKHWYVRARSKHEPVLSKTDIRKPTSDHDFDDSVLKDLYRKNSEHAKQRVALTLKDHERLILGIEKAITERQSSDLSQYAHALKSVAAQIGGTALSAVCLQMEMAGKTNNLTHIDAILKEFRLHNTSFKSAIEDIVNSQSA